MLVALNALGELVNDLDRAQVNDCASSVVAEVATGCHIDLVQVVTGQDVLLNILDRVVHVAIVVGEGDGSDRHLNVGQISIEAVNDDGVHAIVDVLGGDGVHVVDDAHEVAVVVLALSLHEVALVVVERQRDEVIPAGDNNASVIRPGVEIVISDSLAIDHVGDGVAVLVLRNDVAIGGLGGLNELYAGGTGLVGNIDIDGVVLGNLRTNSLVQLAGPVELYGIGVVTVVGSLGTELDHVDTNLGLVVGIVVAVIRIQLVAVVGDVKEHTRE